MTPPAISLLMPALNSARFIGEALTSVVGQLPEGQAEVVVADGGSKDETRRIAAGFPFVRVLDGTDSGIYEGFNRAFAASRGGIVGLLNSDDLLPPLALQRILDLFQDPAKPDVVSGSVSILNGERLENVQPVSVAGLLFGIAGTNGRFFRRELVSAAGPFVTDIGPVSDREFLIRVFKKAARTGRTAEVVYQYRQHAGSATIAGDREARLRIWRSGLKLYRHLLGASWLSDSDKRIVEAARAALYLKWKTAKALQGQDMPEDLAPPADLAAAVRGIALSLKWRRRMSGY